MRIQTISLICVFALTITGYAIARDAPPFYRDAPLAFLEGLKNHDSPLHTLTVPGAVKDWVAEEDIPALLQELDSTEECAGVMTELSSHIPGRSTVGDQAAFLIDGFRTRFYPPRLHSGHYTEAEKQDIRHWWELYQRAATAPSR